MVGIRFVGVGEGERQSEDSFVCYGLKNGNKTRKRKIPKQSTHRSSWQSGKSDGQWEMTAKARWWDLWTQKPGQPAREDESAFLGRWVGISFGCTLAIANARKVPKILPAYA